MIHMQSSTEPEKQQLQLASFVAEGHQLSWSFWQVPVDPVVLHQAFCACLLYWLYPWQ